MKNWILFLDDIRFPENVKKYIGPHENIVICRSIHDARWCVINYGLPSAVHFDHDMTEKHYGGDYSDEQTGLDFAKWLVIFIAKSDYKLPENFHWGVHSMNEVRSQEIRRVMHRCISLKTAKISQ